jgi:GntR family transcriptional regulator
VDAELAAAITSRLRKGRGNRADLVIELDDALREQILSGGLRAGEKLANEIELSLALEISRPTLREASRILSYEGLLTSRHGVGTFVTKKLPRLVHGQLDLVRSMTDVIRRAGGEPGSRDLEVSLVKPPPEAAEALELAAGEEVALIRRTRLIDNRPLGWANEFVALRADGGDFSAVRAFDGGSLFQFVTTTLGCPLSYSKMAIIAASANREMSRRLEIRRGAPLLLMRETHYDLDGKPILYSINYFNTDLVEFTLVRAGLKT